MVQQFTILKSSEQPVHCWVFTKRDAQELTEWANLYRIWTLYSEPWDVDHTLTFLQTHASPFVLGISDGIGGVLVSGDKFPQSVWVRSDSLNGPTNWPQRVDQGLHPGVGKSPEMLQCMFLMHLARELQVLIPGRIWTEDLGLR